MSEYITDWFGIGVQLTNLYESRTPLCLWAKRIRDERRREEIVRCRDCRHAHEVIWPAGSSIPHDYLDCTGELVETWDYYNDEPMMNPVKPDGFCAWGRRKIDAHAERLRGEGVES